jgi:hypothetical protein
MAMNYVPSQYFWTVHMGMDTANLRPTSSATRMGSELSHHRYRPRIMLVNLGRRRE